MKVNNQSGFAHITIVAAVVAAAVIGGVGYFVIQKNNDNSKSKDATAATSTAASSSETSQQASDETAVKAAAKSHFALVYQKKLEAAYQSTCQDFQDLTTFSEFQSFLANPGFQTIDLSLVEYASVDARNNQAKISGSVGPLDPDSTLEVSLLKKNNQWCVYGYSIK